MEIKCLDANGSNCSGEIEYRPSMSPSGKSFPRCVAHYEARLVIQERTVSRYGGRMFY